MLLVLALTYTSPLSKVVYNMADTGWLNPGTEAVYNTAPFNGSVNWTTGNAVANDGSYDSSLAPPAFVDSQGLKCTNFGAAVPSGATIDGVAFQIETNSTGAPTWKYVRLVKGGTVGTDTTEDNTASLPGTDTYVASGSPTSLWGVALTDTDVNASTFGVCVSCTLPAFGSAYIDHVQMKVYYTEATGGITILQSSNRGVERGVLRGAA